jgi:hypothetical protein
MGHHRAAARGWTEEERVEAARARVSTVSLLAHAPALAGALGPRCREVLPAETFVVRGEEGVFAVEGRGALRGNSCSVLPLALLLPLPAAVRLRIYLTAAAEVVQGFATEILGRPWPARDAQSHVRVTSAAIDIWYGPADLTAAALALRPIARAEIGV